MLTKIQTICTRMSKIAKKEEGMTGAEYAALGIIALVVIVGATALAPIVGGMFTSIATSLKV